MTHKLQVKKKRRINHQGRETQKQNQKITEVLQLCGAERMSVYLVMHLAVCKWFSSCVFISVKLEVKAWGM